MYKPIERYKTNSGIRKLPRLLLNILKLAIISFFLYIIVTTFFIQGYTVDSVSMEPTLKTNERVIASSLPYGFPVGSKDRRIGLHKLPKRGDLVIIASPYADRGTLILRIMNSIVDFFTLHRVSLIKDRAGNNISRFMLKRVIGVPGDTVRMDRYRCYIKPPGQAKFIDEMSIIDKNYKIQTKINVKNAKSDYPFNGEMQSITLGENQYFLLGDNRPYSSDSRSWGIVNYRLILAKVILRYWPTNRISYF